MSNQPTTYADEFEVRLALIHACDAMGSQIAFARFAGVTPAYLSQVMSGKHSPSVKLLNSVGYERVLRYRRKPAHAKPAITSGESPRITAGLVP